MSTFRLISRFHGLTGKIRFTKAPSRSFLDNNTIGSCLLLYAFLSKNKLLPCTTSASGFANNPSTNVFRQCSIR